MHINALLTFVTFWCFCFSERSRNLNWREKCVNWTSVKWLKFQVDAICCWVASLWVFWQVMRAGVTIGAVTAAVMPLLRLRRHQTTVAVARLHSQSPMVAGSVARSMMFWTASFTTPDIGLLVRVLKMGLFSENEWWSEAKELPGLSGQLFCRLRFRIKVIISIPDQA